MPICEDKMLSNDGFGFILCYSIDAVVIMKKCRGRALITLFHFQRFNYHYEMKC